jgi:hypothetical protein
MKTSDHIVNPLEQQLTAAQIEKLNLEIEKLKQQHEWTEQISKLLPIIASLIAVCGFLFTVWQAQRNESLTRQQQEKDRIAKIQAQIRSDKEQLDEFLTEAKISSVRVAFLIDDLNSLVEQLPARERETETDSISQQLSRVVWDLHFDSERDVNFDVSALRRWNDFRDRWRSNPATHNGFLARKYYSRMAEIYKKDPKCIENLRYDERTFAFASAQPGKNCQEVFFSILTYGYGEHLDVLAETSRDELKKATDEFQKLTNNPVLAQTLFAKYLPKAKQ